MKETIVGVQVELEGGHHIHLDQSIIEMEGNICDQFGSILIDQGSNYNYIKAELVDQWFLDKELHAGSWLVQLATGWQEESSPLGEILCI